jgi:hypothetical protein
VSDATAAGTRPDTAFMVTEWIFPAPFCLFVRTGIRRERYAMFKELAGQVAFAYQQHPGRRSWSAYGTVAGPALQAYILIPLNALSDLDGMVSLDRVMSDIYGERGADILEKFQDCVVDMSTSVLNRLDVGLGAPGSRDKPPEYLYHVNLNVRPGDAAVFLDGLRRVGQVMPDSPMVVFGTFAGPTRVHGFVMGDSIGDLGVISSLQSQVISGYGAQIGDRIISDMHRALVSSETSILRYIGHQGP